MSRNGSPAPRLPLPEGDVRPTFRRERRAINRGIAPVAAASIVAKVTRDRLMARLGLAHPGYGFERHMGYSVPEHFEALSKLGPTIHHRRSFAPVAELLGLIVPAEEPPPELPL